MYQEIFYGNCFLHPSFASYTPSKKRNVYPWLFICKGKTVLGGSHCVVLMEIFACLCFHGLKECEKHVWCFLGLVVLRWFEALFCGDLWRFFEGGVIGVAEGCSFFFFHFQKGDFGKITKFHFWISFSIFVVAFYNNCFGTCWENAFWNLKLKFWKQYFRTSVCTLKIFWKAKLESYFYTLSRAGLIF